MVPQWISDFLFCHVLPDALEYLAGILQMCIRDSANITMTLGYYAHGTFQSAKAELELSLIHI